MLAISRTIRGGTLWWDALLRDRENVLGRLLEASKWRLGRRRWLRHEQDYSTILRVSQ